MPSAAPFSTPQYAIGLVLVSTVLDDAQNSVEVPGIFNVTAVVLYAEYCLTHYTGVQVHVVSASLNGGTQRTYWTDQADHTSRYIDAPLVFILYQFRGSDAVHGVPVAGLQSDDVSNNCPFYSGSTIQYIGFFTEANTNAPSSATVAPSTSGASSAQDDTITTAALRLAFLIVFLFGQ